MCQSVELKIYNMLYVVHKLYLLLPVLSRHFGLVGVRLVLFPYHPVALSYSGIGTEVFPFTPSDYEMASKKVARVFYPPLARKRFKKVKCYHF